MINPAAVFRIAKAVYPYAVFGYELIRAEIQRARDPEPMPLTFKDVEHQRAQMKSATTGLNAAKK